MIQIYDTTLRDGTQGKGISLSCNDKLRIAQKLDAFGVDFIEGGWPGSNPKDVEFFARARDIEWKNAKIAAFGSTCRANTSPEDDSNIIALVESQAPVCTLFGKTWLLHVTEVLRTTPDENLRMIEESVGFLINQGRRVIFDAEHFFDGYKADPGYALECLTAAKRGGAETLVLADTNGGALTNEVTDIVRAVRDQLQHPLGIHTHNDGDLAVANSLAAVREGCIQVQGTINGYGERCGNANLCSVIPNLEIKLGLKCLPDGRLSQISEVSKFVSEIANLPQNGQLPFVGSFAFAHKGGIHVSAMRRNPYSYQHIEPKIVGNEMHVLISELSGRSNLQSKAESLGMEITQGQEVTAVLNEIKTLESQGFSFEAAEASVSLMLKRQQPDYHPPFEMIDFTVNVEHRQGRGIFAEATVKIRVKGEIIHTAAEGEGPVNALDIALRKALAAHYPSIEKFHLSDYKVRILDGDNGTSATTRVLIDTQNGTKRWSTVGASVNIIEASWRALADSFEYGLMVLYQ